MSGNFYRAFEDRYRGSRALIRERLTVYLPFLAPLAAAGPARALDLGCGRGEWLELLGEAGFAARGVDLDEGMLAACRELGLDVVNEDAIGALRATPAGSLAVVSAFHLVEHISFEQVQELIGEALRALCPGGLLILETPNPENLVVGTSSFYDDPSHLRPLPPKLLAFAVEFGGFARHAVLRLQEAEHLRGQARLQLFDVLGGASPDYSVVGQKAAPAEFLAPADSLFATAQGLDMHTLAQRYQQQLDESHNTAADALAIAGSLRTHLQDSALANEERLGALTGGLAQRIAQLEAALNLQGERNGARLQARIAELEKARQQGEVENGRLAAHVAWIEGRLGHAEAEAAALRHQLSHGILGRSRLAQRARRLLARGRQQLGATALVQRARRPIHRLARGVLQLVLRSPALKGMARSLAARFPGLRARLLRMMYTPAPEDIREEAPADPLTAQMSPRSLAIYRELLKATKHED